jgi:hypothetical protein
MKRFSIVFSFTDRNDSQLSLPIEIEASTLPVGLARATREFWKKQDRKARFDIFKNGLKIEIASKDGEKEAVAV